MFCFLDETAKDDRMLRRKHGWGMRGAVVESTRLLHNGKTVSILTLFGFSGFEDFDWKGGCYNSEEFMDAFDTKKIPHLRPFPQPYSVSKNLKIRARVAARVTK